MSLAMSMPKVRRTQEERSTETRGRLVRATMDLLRKQGYAGVRVEEVSRVAKISRGAQTHHFATRDALILAAVEQIFRESEETTLAAVAKLGPRSDVVQALIDDGVAFFLGPYFIVTVDLLSVGERGGPFRKAILASAIDHRSRVEQAWLDVLVAHGAKSDEAKEALWLAYNAIRGMAVRRFIDSSVASRDQLSRLHAIVANLLPSLRRKPK